MALEAIRDPAIHQDDKPRFGVRFLIVAVRAVQHDIDQKQMGNGCETDILLEGRSGLALHLKARSS